MAHQIELVRNDTLPKIGGSVEYDLSGYTVTLHINFPTVLVKTATILTTSLTESTFEFEFIVGDLDAAVNVYKFELSFDNGSGGIVTYQEDTTNAKLKLKLKEEIA